MIDYKKILAETEPLEKPLHSIPDKHHYAIKRWGLSEQETKYLRERYSKSKNGNKFVQ